jgi:ATPase subunit of ABC transporter with duplicated ATPase domains
MTCHDKDFMNRIVDRIVEIDGGEFTTYTGRLRLLRALARHRERESRGRTRASAGDARERAEFIERFQAHAAKARRCRAA